MEYNSFQYLVALYKPLVFVYDKNGHLNEWKIDYLIYRVISNLLK